MATVSDKARHAAPLAPESHCAAALGDAQAATLHASTAAAGLVRPPAAAQTEAAGLRSSPQAPAAACTTPARPASVLDRILAQQSFAQEPLLPTPTNINPIHLPADDLLHFIAVQQWVLTNLNIQLPLLNGVFVLVQSAALQHAVPAQLQAAYTSSATGASSNVSAQAATMCACIPWRLRQVSAVQVPADVDPADATLLVVGGDRVSAGAVKAGLLDEVQDYEYLCCEVAHMQQSGQTCQLQVLDVAHMAWRLQVACDLATAKEAHDEEIRQQRPVADSAQVSTQAGSAALESARNVLKQLPPQEWVAGQILQYVELNPYTGPVPSGQQPQPLSADQYSQLLRNAAAAWQYYAQQKLAGQQPRPATELVPWRVLENGAEQQTEQETHPGAEVIGVAAAHQLGSAGAAPAEQPAATAGVHSATMTAATQQAAVPLPNASGAAVAAAGAKGADSGQLLPLQQQQQQQLAAEEGKQAMAPHNGPSPVAGALHKPSSSICPGTDTQSPKAPSRRGRSSSHSRSRSRSRSYSRSTGRTSSSEDSRSRSSSRARSQSNSSRKRSPSRSERLAGGRQPPTSSWGGTQARGRQGTSSRHGPAAREDPRRLLEADTRAWLRELAHLLSRRPRGIAGPPAIDLATLRLQLPLPFGLHTHYRSISSMVDARPELGWVKLGRDDCVYIKPEYVPALLHGAQEEQGPSHNRNRSRSSSRSRERKHHHSRSADRRRRRSRSRSHSQHRQRSPRRRHWCGDRSLPGAAPGRAPKNPNSRGPKVITGPPSAEVEREVQRWLEELALLLDPRRPPDCRPETIHTSELMQRLPVPKCVLDHFKSVSRFIKLTPGLKYVGTGKDVGLQPTAHERLRAAAVANGRNRRR